MSNADARGRSTRAVAVLLAAVVLCAAIAGYIVFWAAAEPPTLQSAPSAAGRPAELTLQTVGSLGPRYSQPDWVSYLAQDGDGKWEHTTKLTAPANSLVKVTILQYDSATGLRNNFFSRVQGTTGDVMRLDGRSTGQVDPSTAAHTFAIPQLGVFVPLPGVSASADNQCSVAPCTLEEAHRTITFTFRTKGPGRYRFQCFVPCGAGFYSGNGGPMQSFGYMTGYLTVA